MSCGLLRERRPTRSVSDDPRLLRTSPPQPPSPSTLSLPMRARIIVFERGGRRATCTAVPSPLSRRRSSLPAWARKMSRERGLGVRSTRNWGAAAVDRICGSRSRFGLATGRQRWFRGFGRGARESAPRLPALGTRGRKRSGKAGPPLARSWKAYGQRRDSDSASFTSRSIPASPRPSGPSLCARSTGCSRPSAATAAANSVTSASLPGAR